MIAAADILGFTLMAIVCAIALMLGRRYRRAMYQATADRIMIRRARWMILSITDRDGGIYCNTLEEMLRRPPTDLLWDTPQAAFLWCGNEDRAVIETLTAD